MWRVTTHLFCLYPHPKPNLILVPNTPFIYRFPFSLVTPSPSLYPTACYDTQSIRTLTAQQKCGSGEELCY